MTTQQIKKRDALFIAQQTATGTAATIANNAAPIPVLEPAWEYAGLTAQARPINDGGPGMRGADYGGSGAAVTLITEIAGSTTANTPPYNDLLLRACGLTSTTSAGVITYTPALNSATNPFTLHLRHGQGYTRKMIDAFATSATLTITTGQIIQLSITLTGRYDGESTIAMTPAAPPDYAPITARDTDLTMTAAGTAITDPKIEVATLEFGLEAAQRKDMTDEQGMTAALITDFAPTLAINPEATDYDWLAAMAANHDIGTTMAWGTGPGRVEVAVPAGRINAIGDGERDGVMIRDITMDCAKTAANDDLFSLAFTTS